MGSLLDKARVIHRLPSDYKLALVLGVDQKSLRNYKDAKTLPDARVISLICDLTGDDPALLLAQIEEQRAKTSEARTLWHEVVTRLQAGATAAIFAVVFQVVGMVGFPNDASAAPVNLTSYTSWNVAGFARLIRRLFTAGARMIRGFYDHVQGPPSTAAA
jgi:hypothetical protein